MKKELVQGMALIRSVTKPNNHNERIMLALGMIGYFYSGLYEPFRIVQKEQKLHGQSVFKITLYFVYFQLAR